MSKDVRHFILEIVDFGKLDVIEYKEYQKLDKEIERLNKVIKKLEKDIEKIKKELLKGCSHTYEDSLGKTRYVNEDIYNELSKISNSLQKLKENKQ